MIFVKKSKSTKEKKKKQHICDICGKSLKEKETLKLHIAAVHEKKKLFKCRKCESSYSYRSGLIEHMKSGRCKGAPSRENKWIKWEKGGASEPKGTTHLTCILLIQMILKITNAQIALRGSLWQ